MIRIDFISPLLKWFPPAVHGLNYKVKKAPSCEFILATLLKRFLAILPINYKLSMIFETEIGGHGHPCPRIMSAVGPG